MDTCKDSVTKHYKQWFHYLGVGSAISLCVGFYSEWRIERFVHHCEAVERTYFEIAPVFAS